MVLAEIPGVVLVVDDVAANRALIRETLEDEGHRVIEVTNGPDAIAAFAREPPDCVLMDVRMPGLDGVATCARIRDLPGGVETPVLFVTALRDLDTYDHAMAVGAFDYLTKPVRPSELVARVRAALALRRKSAERDELAQLLRHQRDELMRSVLVNERLAAFLVHDLKNPVAGMQLGAQIIERDMGASPKSREIAGRIHAQAGDVLRMILGLLDISKATEGQLVLARCGVALGGLLDGVRQRFATQAEARAVTLVFECAVAEASLDANLFRRVIENLVDNALRHAPAQSEVQVVVEGDNHDLVVSVADRGPGVPTELREHIFDRFVQAESARMTRGRGLGLAFCKFVVEAHVGQIWIEDANPGAVIRTRWPNVI